MIVVYYEDALFPSHHQKLSKLNGKEALGLSIILDMQNVRNLLCGIEHPKFVTYDDSMYGPKRMK